MRCLLFALTLALCPVAWGVEFRSVEFEAKSYTVAEVDLGAESLELFLKDDKGATFKRFSTLDQWLDARGRKLVFAMNAGMYHPDYSAVGVFVAEGKELAPVNLQSGAGNFFLKPNGVFAITGRGASIVESSRYGELGNVRLATQSGPMLVLGGKLHPAFIRGSENKLHRNGVGVRGAKSVVFVISEAPVNFDEFARLFRDELKCPDALFLDGTVSSLHATALKRSDFHIDLGPLIGVTALK